MIKKFFVKSDIFDGSFQAFFDPFLDKYEMFFCLLLKKKRKNAMSFITSGVVKYYSFDNYLIVGDNKTQQTGITNPSYSGEIVIPETVEGKRVKEIGYYAFYRCSEITKVTIHANITSINYHAFAYCSKINYINVPSTVTFIGQGGMGLIYYDKVNGSYTVDLMTTVKFNEGRTEKVYISSYGIDGRVKFNIIYPSNLEPLYNPNYQFYYTTTASFLYCF